MALQYTTISEDSIIDQAPSIALTVQDLIDIIARLDNELEKAKLSIEEKEDIIDELNDELELLRNK